MGEPSTAPSIRSCYQFAAGFLLCDIAKSPVAADGLAWEAMFQVRAAIGAHKMAGVMLGLVMTIVGVFYDCIHVLLYPIVKTPETMECRLLLALPVCGLLIRVLRLRHIILSGRPLIMMGAALLFLWPDYPRAGSPLAIWGVVSTIAVDILKLGLLIWFVKEAVLLEQLRAGTGADGSYRAAARHHP